MPDMWMGILTGVISAAIGFGLRHAWGVFIEHRQTIGQCAIFSGLESPTLFVLPPRPLEPAHEMRPPILPRTSTEDFLAANNIIGAYLQIGWDPPAHIRQPDRLLPEDRSENNLILLCSSHRNEATKEAIEKLRSLNPEFSDLIPIFEIDETTKNRQIRWNKGTFPSESFSQEGPTYNDTAVIVKAQNPWARDRKILIVAGIRGFGTWGAGEFLRKSLNELYDEKRKSRAKRISKTGNFVALVNVEYKDFDIKDVKLINIVDLDGKY